MTIRTLRKLCAPHGLTIEETCDGLETAIEVACPDGWCFDEDHRTVVECYYPGEKRDAVINLVAEIGALLPLKKEDAE